MKGKDLIQTVNEITGRKMNATQAKKFALDHFGELCAHIRNNVVLEIKQAHKVNEQDREQKRKTFLKHMGIDNETAGMEIDYTKAGRKPRPFHRN